MPVVSSRLAAICLLSLLAAGCATSQSMSDADRAQVAAVNISDNVQMPAKITYLGPLGGAGLMFGVAGALATVSPNNDDGMKLQAFAEQNNVSIQKIVTDELAAAIKDSGKIHLTDSPTDASATITVNIKQYGFSVVHSFGSGLVPILFVQCSMVDKSGRVIWQGGDAIRPLGNPVDSVKTTDLQDPAVIEKEWRLGAKAVAKDIVSGLPGAAAQP
jgi:PBP1b-binding outer membrane lipoprotein LpoB